MQVAKVFHMNGGTGEASYAKNSLLQQKGILMTKKITDEAITALYRSHSPETICIADLGCSSGPNTFLGVTGLIKTIHQECKSNGYQSPEFHVFLNDLPSNDFNSVFRSLPAFHEDLKKQNMGGEGFDPPSCFVGGVAGSFYTRIFPSKSLHFVLSSNSLHWLSQVPDGIENNNGNIYATNTSPPSLLKAYYEQYERDFVIFLKYRSDELVKGGRMALTMAGRKNEERSFNKGSRYLLEPLVRALKDMVAEGSIEEEKVNSFNIAAYCPCPAEVMYIVDKEGSFTIDVLETLEFHMDASDGNYNMVQGLRAFVEPLLISHFGDDELINQVFHKCRDIFVNCMPKGKIMFTSVIVSLTKKN